MENQQLHDRTLYGFWLSPYMSIVAHVLKESGLDFNYQRVSPFVGATLGDSHRARNSLGKIPSLEESSGLVISESQAICRYLSRTYESAQHLYPCHDPIRCAEVDRVNDFLTFSISGPFFYWFVVGGYWPQAWGAKTKKESDIFSSWSMVMIKSGLARLTEGSQMSPFLLGAEPLLPDFHLFHILELGKTFSKIFELPFLNVLEGDVVLQKFYDAMLLRPSTVAILEEQAGEHDATRREIFEEFGDAYADILKPAKAGLSMLFGHEV